MSWLIVFLGFCFLIMVHEAGHFVAAKATGMRVERFFLFFGPTIWSFKRGETEYGIKSIPIGGYVKITGMNPEEDVPPEHAENAYFRKPVWKRIVVVAAGPAVNIVLAFLILFGVFFGYGKPELTQRVADVEHGPAAKVLHKGDEIIAIDGKRFIGIDREERLTRFANLVKSHKCAGGQHPGCLSATPVIITIRSNGQIHTVAVRSHYDKAEKRMLIGFRYEEDRAPVTIGSAFSEAGNGVKTVATATFHRLTHIFESQQRNQIHGVVGISDVGHEAVQTGLEESLVLLALVSLSLGLINLLPILPLDGGHILWALVEKLRGGPVSLRIIERATVLGFALVLVLIFIGLSNDIGQISGGGIRSAK